MIVSHPVPHQSLYIAPLFCSVSLGWNRWQWDLPSPKRAALCEARGKIFGFMVMIGESFFPVIKLPLSALNLSIFGEPQVGLGLRYRVYFPVKKCKLALLQPLLLEQLGPVKKDLGSILTGTSVSQRSR